MKLENLGPCTFTSTFTRSCSPCAVRLERTSFDRRRDWRSWFMPQFVGVIIALSSGIVPCTTPVSYLPFLDLRITLIDITRSSTPVTRKTIRHIMGFLKGRLHNMLWTLEYLDLKRSSFTLKLLNGLIRDTLARPLLSLFSFRHVLML